MATHLYIMPHFGTTQSLLRIWLSGELWLPSKTNMERLHQKSANHLSGKNFMVSKTMSIFAIDQSFQNGLFTDRGRVTFSKKRGPSFNGLANSGASTVFGNTYYNCLFPHHLLEKFPESSFKRLQINFFLKLQNFSILFRANLKIKFIIESMYH